MQDKEIGLIKRVIAKDRKIGFCTSLVVTIAFTFGYLRNIQNSLPHIISFSSVVLAVTSLVFSMLLCVKDSRLFKKILKERKGSIDHLYRNLRSSIVNCIVVIILSIAILVVDIPDSIFIQIPIAFIGTYKFALMLCQTLSVFLFCMDLLEHGDE